MEMYCSIMHMHFAQINSELPLTNLSFDPQNNIFNYPVYGKPNRDLDLKSFGSVWFNPSSFVPYIIV